MARRPRQHARRVRSPEPDLPPHSAPLHDGAMHSSNNLVRRTLVILSMVSATTASLLITEAGKAQTPTPKTTTISSRHIVLPPRKDALPYSDAVLVGDTLYLAGRIGIDPETGKPPAELEKEIRLLLDGMKTTLAAANMTMDDLVSVRSFVPTSPCTKSSTKFTAPTSSRISPPAPSSAPARSSAAAASKCRGSLSGANRRDPRHRPSQMRTRRNGVCCN
jgi:enamine deaminase RidA (YjgF/YER057c/UK114 family)